MAGIIGLLKPGGGLPPGNKSLCLDVGTTARPEKQRENNQPVHREWFTFDVRQKVGMPKPRTTAGLAASVMSQAMTRDHRLFEPMSASR